MDAVKEMGDVDMAESDEFPCRAEDLARYLESAEERG